MSKLSFYKHVPYVAMIIALSERLQQAIESQRSCFSCRG